MTKISDNISSYQNLAQYDADMGKDYPNVSYLINEDEVKWVKDDPLLVVKYNVTSTSSATELLNSNSNITYQIIDGVQQQSVQRTYTFDTLGEHIVKYKYKNTFIASDAFNFCPSIINVSIPSSVTVIAGNAFYSCTYLRYIIIPSSVTTFGNSVFGNCVRLTSITVKATTPPTLGSNVFNKTNNCPIYVPAESVEAYKAASGWTSYASRIQAI